MLVSKTSRYALQAACRLAELADDGSAVQAAVLAEATGVPRNYLSKILHQLVRQGILVSERGPKGGFRLADDPSKITLAAVAEAVDPGMSDPQCLLGRPKCSDRSPCGAHEEWKALTGRVRAFLNETSLEDLIQAR